MSQKVLHQQIWSAHFHVFDSVFFLNSTTRSYSQLLSGADSELRPLGEARVAALSLKYDDSGMSGAAALCALLEAQDQFRQVKQ